MKAIILAAGRGSRMKELTANKPKCLTEISGETLLKKQLDALHGAGITEIGIVTGYKSEMLNNIGLHEFHNLEWATTNMVYSLTKARAWLNSSDCIVSYSDIFYESSAVELLASATGEIAITYDPNWLDIWSKRFTNPLVDAETFKLKKGKLYLEEIGKRPLSVADVEGQYMGLLKFTPIGWQKLENFRSTLSEHERHCMHMTGTLQKLIDCKIAEIQALPYYGSWGEVDSAEDLKAYTINSK